MGDFFQALVSGAGPGAIDGLLAIGIVLIYRVSGVLNFAQAGIGAVGGYVIYSVALGHPLWLALLVGVLAGVAASVGTNVVVRSMGGAHPALNSAVATLAVAVLLRQVIQVAWGSTLGSYPSPWGAEGWTVGSVSIPYLFAAAVGTGCVLIATTVLFLRGTRTGTMIRAVENNPTGALMCGGNVPLLILGVWVVAGIAATLSAFFAFQIVFEPAQLDTFFVGALIAAVAAGLRSLPGALVAALVLEMAKTLFGLYAPAAAAPYAETFLLVLLIGVLVFAPRGWLMHQTIRTA